MQEIKSEKRARWIFYILMTPVLYFQLKYRLNHPELSETQLFIDFFKAFVE